MRQRYFLIEPKYSDPDTYCHFVIGSDRVRASIQIYADLWMLSEAAAALTAATVKEETPFVAEFEDGDDLFYFYLTVLPHDGGNRCLRFRVFQDWLTTAHLPTGRTSDSTCRRRKPMNLPMNSRRGVRSRNTPSCGKTGN
jgi:hypothetical protein